MPDRVRDRVVRHFQVENAASDEHLQETAPVHGLGEIAADVGIARVDRIGIHRGGPARLPVPLQIDLGIAAQVPAVGPETQLIPEIGGHGRLQGTGEEKGPLVVVVARVRSEGGHPGIVDADGPAFPFQELSGEFPLADPQIPVQDPPGVDPRVVGEPFRRLPPIPLRKGVPLPEQGQKPARGPLPDLFQGLVQIPPKAGGDLFMVPGGGGVGGQGKDHGPVPHGRPLDVLQIQGGGDEDEPDGIDPGILKDPGQPRAPDPPVAFPGDEDGGMEAVHDRQELKDEVGHGPEVLPDAPELPGIDVAEGPAVAGPDGIDEDEVREIEEGVRVLHDAVRGREKDRSVVAPADRLRTQGRQVQVHGGRSRPAVEGEGQGADFPLPGVLLPVIDEEDLRARFPRRRIGNGEKPRRGGVGQGFAVHPDGVSGLRKGRFRRSGASAFRAGAGGGGDEGREHRHSQKESFPHARFLPVRI